MSFLKKFFFFLIFFLLFSTSFASDAKFECSKKLYQAKLENGFEYYLIKNNEPKDRVSMHLFIGAGSLYEKDSEQGIAHFLEHMLFNGTKNFKGEELIKFFQSIGMKFGADANAYTSFDKTVYDISLPKKDEKSLKQGLFVFKDFLINATLANTEIAKEAKVVLAEKKTRDSAQYKAFVESLKFYFGNDALICTRLPIGKEKNIKSFDHKMFKEFYTGFYTPENARLIVVGDFDIKLLSKLIGDEFGSIKKLKTRDKVKNFAKANHKGEKFFVFYNPELSNVEIMIERLEPFNKKDSKELRQEAIEENLANKILQYRIQKELLKEDVPFQTGNISTGTFLKKFKFSSISTESLGNNWTQSLKFMEKLLRATLKHGFLDEEVKRAKKDLLAELEKEEIKEANKNSEEIARELINTIDQNKIYLDAKQEKALFEKYIKNLDKDAIHKTFKKMWKKDHRLILVQTNVKIDKDKIVKVYNDSKKEKIKKPEKEKDIIFPYFKIPPKSSIEKNIIEKKEDKELGITHIKLKNNIVINLKKTDFKKDEVSCSISFGRGKFVEPNNMPALSSLAQKVISKSGIAKFDLDQTGRLLSGKNINIDFAIGDDAFVFYANSYAKELEFVMQLLYAHIKDAQYRQSSLSFAHKKMQEEYTKIEHDVRHATQLSEGFLSGSDSRFSYPKLDSLLKYTTDDIKNWIQTPLLNEALEISIVGDFDIEKTSNLLIQYFSNLPKREFIANDSKKASLDFPTGEEKTIFVKSKIKKSIVQIAYPIEKNCSIKEKRQFVILSEILTDKLRQTIREELGKSYSQYANFSYHDAYPEFNMIKIFVYIDDENEEEIILNVQSIIDKIKKDGVDELALKSALSPIFAHLKDALRNNQYWLNGVLLNSIRHPEKFENAKSLFSDYKSIKKEDITKLARKYLDHQKSAKIIIRPKK